MWFRTRLLREENGDLRAQLDRMRARAEAAERTVQTEQFARNTMARQFGEADAANKRLVGRNRHLTDQLEQAREAAQDGALEEMGRRLDRALQACARYLDAYHTQCRVNDRLSDQLMGAMGYTDAGLKALGVTLAEGARENGGVKQ